MVAYLLEQSANMDALRKGYPFRWNRSADPTGINTLDKLGTTGKWHLPNESEPSLAVGSEGDALVYSMMLSSSMAEQTAVNRQVGGSSPLLAVLIR